MTGERNFRFMFLTLATPLNSQRGQRKPVCLLSLIRLYRTVRPSTKLPSGETLTAGGFWRLQNADQTAGTLADAAIRWMFSCRIELVLQR